jgi:hypothetical protein
MFRDCGEDWSLMRDVAASDQIAQYKAIALSDEEEIPHFHMQINDIQIEFPFVKLRTMIPFRWRGKSDSMKVVQKSQYVRSKPWTI